MWRSRFLLPKRSLEVPFGTRSTKRTQAPAGTTSGTAKLYRPKKLICRQVSGESRKVCVLNHPALDIELGYHAPCN